MKLIKEILRAYFVLWLVLLMISSVVFAESTTSNYNTDYESVTVIRLYNEVSVEHLLTTEQKEINELSKEDWINEGIMFFAPGVVTEIQVKRFYNPETGTHLYTSDIIEWDYLTQWGWIDEGIAFYGATSEVYPIYRLYTPQNKVAPYLYTSNENEQNQLSSNSNDSWIQEGIGWYADSLEDMSKYTLETQKLDLPSITNVRQLGGYEMPDGRKVKDNMLIRSAALDELSEEDKAKLEAINLKAVIDLRSDLEANTHPDIVPKGAISYNLPALDELNVYDQETLEALRKALSNSDANLGVDALIVLAELKGLDQMYAKFLNQDIAKHAYREMFKILLENAKSDNPGAVLWHCTQGKDRAGVASALILTALGADDATVLRDYSLTTGSYTEEIKQMEQLAKDIGLSLETTHQLLGMVGFAYPEYLQLAIDSVGSLKSYLINDLGLTETDLKILQDAYLE